MVIPYGAMINALFVIVGGGLGLLLGSRLPDRVRKIVFQGLGLCTLSIGIKMALVTQNPILVIFSVVLGGILGELVHLEDGLLRVGDWFKKCFHSRNPRFTEGMVNASVLFCIGAMAILGSFDEGLRGDRTVVLSKSMLDGFAALALASAYGVGVLFSAITILVYQGTLIMCAGLIQPWFSEAIMTELTAVGGIMIVGIGLTLLEIVRIPLSNMLPALGAVVVLAGLCG